MSVVAASRPSAARAEATTVTGDSQTAYGPTASCHGSLQMISYESYEWLTITWL